MKFLRSSLLVIVSLIFCTAAQATAPTFVEGKDYQRVQLTTAPASPLPAGKIQVLEFFNYGCPACNHFEPALEKWLATSKPCDVAFERVPVVFHKEWDLFSRAYYVAKGLNVEAQVTPAMFSAIHQQGLDLSTPAAVANIFAKFNIKPADFNDALQFSPGIDAQMMRGENLMGVYKTFEIPVLIINGQYRVSLGMVNGDNQRMLSIADYLISKVRAAQH